MAEKSVYDQIKKQNGEAFARAIRNYDNGIFEIPDILRIVKYAGREAEPILKNLEFLKSVKIEEIDTGKDPFQLLDEAGYDAYYADTLEKQNAIQKYFEPKEELCTFRDPYRYKNYYIVNAVRKDVDKIKRENFRGNEQREDEYGRSVISIQISKDGKFISIKNRYNHAVESPDYTFYSNPDIIIKGLSASLKKYFNTDFSSQPEKLRNNFVYVDKQIIRYHYEFVNTYYGSDFYVKNGVVQELDKDKEIMLDKYVLNIKDRTIYDPAFFITPLRPLDEEKKYWWNNEVDTLTAELKNKKISIRKNKAGGHDVLADGVAIISVKEGCITDLYLPTTKRIYHGFLRHNRTLETFSAPQLEEIKDDFLYTSILHGNSSLKKFYAPKLMKVGNNFLHDNIYLSEIYAPNLIKIGDGFLYNNVFLEKLDLPNVKKIGENFLAINKRLKVFNALQLEFVDDAFLQNNLCIEYLNLPNLRFAGCKFMIFNTLLKTLNAPKLKEVNGAFLDRATYKTNAPALVNKIEPDRILPSEKKDEQTSILMSLVDMFNLCPVLLRRNIVCSKRLMKYEMKGFFLEFVMH